MLELSKQAGPVCANAIFITGSARSGTSIVGQLVHSMRQVEYAYEPPMMVSLMALIDQLDEASWKLLFETYIYEEFFLNAIAGRAINCNVADFSSIYKAKSVEEVENRLSAHFAREACQQAAESAVAAIKIPDVVYTVPRLKAYYPSMRVVVVMRNAVDTLNSLLQKQWFSRQTPASDALWPFKTCKGVNMPYWVRPGDEELWVELSEIDRAAYYYIRVSEDVGRIDGRIEVKYAELLETPREVAGSLAASLGLDFGAKTDEVIDLIRPTHPVRDRKIIESISAEFRDKVEHYSSGL